MNRLEIGKCLCYDINGPNIYYIYVRNVRNIFTLNNILLFYSSVSTSSCKRIRRERRSNSEREKQKKLNDGRNKKKKTTKKKTKQKRIIFEFIWRRKEKKNHKNIAVFFGDMVGLVFIWSSEYFTTHITLIRYTECNIQFLVVHLWFLHFDRKF